MGAEQSSQRSAAPEATPQKTCYYELLGCARTATDDELKKAYRRKALELHPDRNFSDVANATRKFAEVQTAYEILSDAQERAWYDAHRDDILRGDSGAAGDDEDGGGGGSGAGPRYYNNVRLTPAEELYTLMGRFSRSVPFDDSPYGFFGILEATFAQLALEEEAAFSWDATRSASAAAAPPTYHPFGSAADDYDAVAKPFYKDWTNFATVKSFSWKDKYRLSDAPDRQVRRLMDKDNRKAREQGVREFNDAVRSLVAFVRKRDPRYVPNQQSEAERQQVLRDSAQAQAQRQRAANQERRRQMQAQAAYVEPGFRADERAAGVSSADDDDDDDDAQPDDDVAEEIECVVCDKTFKSEKQFEAHEKSRKHVKAVQTLKWQMRKEHKALNLDEHELLPPRDNEAGTGKKGKKGKSRTEEEAEEAEEADEAEEAGEKDGDDEDEEDESNDEYAPRHVVESRFKVADENGDEEEDEDDDTDNEFAARMKKMSLKKQKKKKKQMKQMGFFEEEEEEEDEGKDESAKEKEGKEDKKEKEDTTTTTKKEDTDNGDDDNSPAKMGKAKARREKRAAIQAAAAAAAGENEGVVACTLCRKTFASNTKLHQHLRSDHTAAKGKGKKKK